MHYKEILIAPTLSIKEALEVIDRGAKRIALVVDEEQRLLGTLSDGDIRRGLLRGLGLEDSIEEIIFRTPTVGYLSETQEEILNKALSKSLYQIPILDDAGRVVGIEAVETLLTPKIKTNRVVLMVGGLGTRLRPLTEETPKPMLKVGDRPILETIILNFKKHGFVNIILSVRYKAEKIIEYFGDGSAFGVNIKYLHEEQRMGTAGALGLIAEGLDEDFFVMNGDLLTNMNFGTMLEYHLGHHAYATMGVREYEYQVPYGVVNVDGVEIKSIQEKPVQHFFVSGGVYILSPKVLSYIPKDTFFDMPTLFEHLIAEGKRSISFPIRDYWLDIGRIEEFEKANREYYEVF